MNSTIRDLEEFRERRHVFADRSEAGEILGAMLQADYGVMADGMVLGIPSGGVPVAMKVSEKMGLPFDLQIVRKLQIPGNTEAGFGAMALDGTVFFNILLLAQLELSEAQIEAEKERVRLELERRNIRFRKGRPFPDLSGRHVIVVDDGLASGFTMLASLDAVRNAGARKTIVAVPTAPQRSIERILPSADKIYCANIRSGWSFAVAEAYRNWYDLSESEVINLLNEAEAIGHFKTPV